MWVAVPLFERHVRRHFVLDAKQVWVEQLRGATHRPYQSEACQDISRVEGAGERTACGCRAQTKYAWLTLIGRVPSRRVFRSRAKARFHRDRNQQTPMTFR
jgi:hypothetical protein